MSYKRWQPKLGDVESIGSTGEYRVYTMRGWVRCDNYKEMSEELDNVLEYVETHKRKGFTNTNTI